jgi:hypothetical protein
MSSRQRRQRCPSLSAWRNVLPLFFANEALPRRDTARRILGAAGGANKRVHLTAPGTCALCHWLYAIPLARGTPKLLSCSSPRRPKSASPMRATSSRCSAASGAAVNRTGGVPSLLARARFSARPVSQPRSAALGDTGYGNPSRNGAIASHLCEAPALPSFRWRRDLVEP